MRFVPDHILRTWREAQEARDADWRRAVDVIVRAVFCGHTGQPSPTTLSGFSDAHQAVLASTLEGAHDLWLDGVNPMLEPALSAIAQGVMGNDDADARVAGAVVDQVATLLLSWGISRDVLDGALGGARAHASPPTDAPSEAHHERDRARLEEAMCDLAVGYLAVDDPLGSLSDGAILSILGSVRHAFASWGLDAGRVGRLMQAAGSPPTPSGNRASEE
jgi:hypothetical protein